jgi:D-3-phosphoglycerate dehydrogenase / 2-oxoglutarate reductase
MKVLLLENIHPVGEAALKAEGFEVQRIDAALREEELIAQLKGVHLLGIRSKTRVTPRVLEAGRELIAVGAYCIGTNQVALDAAMRRGVCVFNAPFSNTRSVAELVMAEIIMLSRQLGDRSKEVHQGVWKKLAAGSREVRGKTLGIVGYGHIGTQVGLLAEFFGMRVVYFDVAPKLPLGNVRAEATLDQVLASSDFVTLHVPETPQTKGMIGAKQLQAMKPGACLLNLSRGTVVDLDALAKALKDKHLAGAAVDVYPDEPEGNTAQGFVTPLQGLDNVVLTPHIGGSTLEAQEAIGKEVSASLTRYVRTGASTGSVNFPHVELAPTPKTWRVVHVHQNVPGVLRDVNRIVSDQNANIHAQLLSTTSELGYLIMDLDQPVATAVCDAMLKLPTTLSARALSSGP